MCLCLWLYANAAMRWCDLFRSQEFFQPNKMTIARMRMAKKIKKKNTNKLNWNNENMG